MLHWSIRTYVFSIFFQYYIPQLSKRYLVHKLQFLLICSTELHRVPQHMWWKDIKTNIDQSNQSNHLWGGADAKLLPLNFTRHFQIHYSLSFRAMITFVSSLFCAQTDLLQNFQLNFRHVFTDCLLPLSHTCAFTLRYNTHSCCLSVQG